MDSFKIKSRLFDQLSEEEFLHFSEEQRHVLRIERNSNGEIIFMSPSLPYISNFIAIISFELVLWNKKTKSGLVFDSSAGFTLPNTAVKAPDVSWISKEKWNMAMSDEANKKRFPHVVPEFVIEVKSDSDSLKQQKNKMEEWISNGCILSWLIDYRGEKVFIYRKDGTSEEKDFDATLRGEDLLPGFSLAIKDCKT